MDHGAHSGEMVQPRCSMNMLWNAQIEHTCVFVLSCLAIVALGVFYEYLRALQKTVDARIAASLSKGKRARRSRSSSRASESAEDALLLSGRVLGKPSTGVPVFLSFFLMLVFMTYNAYLIFAVVVGAVIGHYVFGGELNLGTLGEDKGLACH
ncbi:Ctr copper transporter family-domain-containing protein [Armillaria mellea]|nr:Ctr copper transporter family-domain-containing protein [Armillaria mellea]